MSCVGLVRSIGRAVCWMGAGPGQLRSVTRFFLMVAHCLWIKKHTIAYQYSDTFVVVLVSAKAVFGWLGGRDTERDRDRDTETQRRKTDTETQRHKRGREREKEIVREGGRGSAPNAHVFPL